MSQPRPIEQKFLSLFGREQAYWTALASLTVFNLALVLFGFSPSFFRIGTLARNLEYFAGVLAIVVIMLMWLHAFNKFLIITRWAYLMASFVTALATILFISGFPYNQLSFLGEFIILLLLTTGGLIEISMHVEHGGRKVTFREKP